MKEIPSTMLLYTARICHKLREKIFSKQSHVLLLIINRCTREGHMTLGCPQYYWFHFKSILLGLNPFTVTESRICVLYKMRDCFVQIVISDTRSLFKDMDEFSPLQ